MDHVNQGEEPGLETTDPDVAARPSDLTATVPLAEEWDSDEIDGDASTIPDEADASTLTFLDPPEGPDCIGSLDGYPVHGILGQGAMGIVLKAFDRWLHRPVAIKVLSPVLASSASFRERFLREARAAAAINHANVVTIHAVGDHRGLPYLVMEYIPGLTLAQRIRAQPRLGPINMVRIGVQIAEGLEAAHRHGLIHRDVKPSNLMLEDSIERVKITDFGLARAAMDQSGLTSLGRIVGTPAYMSPEQVGGSSLDARADLFALGCVFWAMATGHSPFRASHMVGIIRNVQETTPPPLKEVDPRIPAELSRIVERLLEKKPEARYLSAAEVSGALSRLLSRLQQDGEDCEASVSATESLPIGMKPRRRLPRGRLLAGAFVLPAVIGLALGLARLGRHSDPVVPANPVVPAPIPRTFGPNSVTVSHTGPADFRSLADALTVPRHGVEIHVLDDATYKGELRFTDSSRLSDLKLISHRGATLEAPGAEQVVYVRDTPGIIIEGFRLVTGVNQHAVKILGASPGLTLRRLLVQCSPSGQWAAVYLTASAHGDRDRPIAIRDSEFRNGRLGIILRPITPDPVAEVTIEGNRFLGVGTHIQLLESARDIRVVSNIFGGGKGMSFMLDNPEQSGAILVVNNTYNNPTHWWNPDRTPPGIENVTLCRNLILGGDIQESIFPIEDIIRGWKIEDNRWVPGDAASDGARTLLVARRHPAVPFLSDDESRPDFLVPAAGSDLELEAAQDDQLKYIGARPPSR